MDKTNIFKSQRRIEMENYFKSLKIMSIDENSTVDEVALALAEDTITTAVKTVEDARNPIKNIQWITHGEFTVERGRRQIAAFVLTWEYESRWVQYTDFVEKKDLIHTFYYNYCVRWSVPTARRPMAEVSAACFFTIKISKGKPPSAPIDVSYIFEGQELVHRPGMSRFREKWLRDIIEAKHVLLESIPF